MSPELSALVATLLNNIKTGIISFEYSINLTLVFHDGSQVTFTYDPRNETWSYVLGSARDAHGNLIPDNYQSIAGSAGGTNVYNFTKPYPGYDITNFDTLLQNYGIQPTGSSTKVLACVSSGGETVCHFVTIPR